MRARRRTLLSGWTWAIAEKIQAMEVVAVEVAVIAETAVDHPMIYFSDFFWEYAEAVAQTAVAVVVLAVAAVLHFFRHSFHRPADQKKTPLR
jgi:hypothetical protein